MSLRFSSRTIPRTMRATAAATPLLVYLIRSVAASRRRARPDRERAVSVLADDVRVPRVRPRRAETSKMSGHLLRGLPMDAGEPGVSEPHLREGWCDGVGSAREKESRWTMTSHGATSPRISPKSLAPRAAAAGRPTFHPPPLRTTTRRSGTPTSIPTRKRDRAPAPKSSSSLRPGDRARRRGVRPARVSGSRACGGCSVCACPRCAGSGRARWQFRGWFAPRPRAGRPRARGV